MKSTKTAPEALRKLRQNRRKKDYCSAEENKRFFEEGLTRLSGEGLTQSSGELIVSLFAIKATRRLRTYAIRWVQAFPDDISTPEVISRWMFSFPDQEVLGIAERYLSSLEWSCDELRPIIRSVCLLPYRPKLHKLVAELLEKNPTLEMWSSVLPLPRERSAHIERLQLRWLELNIDNPEAVPFSLSFSPQSAQVTKAILRWIRKHPNQDRYVGMMLAELLRMHPRQRRALRAELTKAARIWVKAHPAGRDAAYAHSALVRENCLEADRKNAKDWYIAHKTEDSALHVLREFLDPNGAPSWAVTEAEALLKRQAREERSPGIVGRLVSLTKDPAIIRIATEVYREKQHEWILCRLVVATKDHELICEAEAALAKHDGKSKGEFLYALLRARPLDSNFRRRARNWIMRYPKTEYAAEVRRLLRRENET